MKQPEGYFVGGDVEAAGECGIYKACIDHVNTPDGGTNKTWFARIVVYGDDAEQAKKLRKYILKRLNKGDKHVREPV